MQYYSGDLKTLHRLVTQIRKRQFALFMGFALLLTLLIRLALLEFHTSDILHMIDWLENMKRHGGLWGGIGHSQSAYPPLYNLLLMLSGTLFGFLTPDVQVKLAAVPFDYVAAYFGFKLVRLKYPTGPLPWVALFSILLMPTSILNSSAWGQIEMIPISGLLAGAYYLAKRNIRYAMVGFSLAFAIKLQTVFIFPFLAALVLKKVIPWKELLWIPGIYFLAGIPGLVSGMGLGDLFGIYLTQTGFQTCLSCLAPNLYLWLPNAPEPIFFRAGLFLAFTVFLLFVYGVYRLPVRKWKEFCITGATTSVLLAPFFLPRMHDRYFMMADVFAVIFAFYFPRRFYVPLLIIGASYCSYIPFMFGVSPPIPLVHAALGMAVALGILVWDLFEPALKAKRS